MQIPRRIFADIWQYINSDKIIILNGARQVGKTTLMTMIKDKLLADGLAVESQILWYDLEKAEHLEIFSSQTLAFAKLPVNDIAKKYYLFLDEFQRSKSIGSLLKVIHDHYPHIKVIATGSASWYLDIDESLAGREIVVPVWPLDFQEFLSIQTDKKYLDQYELQNKIFSAGHDTVSAGLIDIVNQKLIDFIRFGGYPGIAKTDSEDDKIRFLQELVSSYIIRDIQLWNYAANTLEVKKILALLAGRIATFLDISGLCADAGVGRTLLVNRLDLLRNTFILQLISPYFTNKSKEVTKNPKLFLNDTGLRNAILNTFSIVPQTEEFGHLVENFVAAELLKRADLKTSVHAWRTPSGQEVDFVLKRENELIPVEIKSGNQAEVPSGLKSFIRQYSPRRAYVLNWSITKNETIGQTKILFRPLWFSNL